MGKIRTKTNQAHPQEQFLDATRSKKLQQTLVLMADRYDEQARDHILATYTNDRLMQAYRTIRNSGEYEKGGKNRRKLFEIPDMIIWDFIDTTMKALYGINWLHNNKALRHELIRPWWVVNKL